MGTIKRFEDLDTWKKARILTRQVFDLTSKESFRGDWSLRDQLRRASVSTMANIAEGFERGGDREFLQFLSIAKGSVGELKSHLYVAQDAGLVTEDQFRELYALSVDTGELIGGFMKYLRQSDMKGQKYRS